MQALKLFLATAVVAAIAAVAVAAAAAEPFPDAATTPAAAALKQHLDDRVFSVTLANGTTWRLEYKSRGHFFVNTSTGFNGVGDWQVEDGRLCGQVRGRDRSCSEVRLHDGVLYLKRADGEVVRYTPK